MPHLHLVLLAACLVTAALAQAQSSALSSSAWAPPSSHPPLTLSRALPAGVSNLESFPTILNPASSTAPPSSPAPSPSSGATAFDPSRFPSAPGPALPYTSSDSLSLSAPTNSTSSPSLSRTTLISASHSPLPSLDPSATEYVVTSTVGGSVATVTVTSTASTSPGAQAGGSSGAASGPRGAGSGWSEVGALVGAVGALALALWGGAASRDGPSRCRWVQPSTRARSHRLREKDDARSLLPFPPSLSLSSVRLSSQSVAYPPRSSRVVPRRVRKPFYLSLFESFEREESRSLSASRSSSSRLHETRKHSVVYVLQVGPSASHADAATSPSASWTPACCATAAAAGGAGGCCGGTYGEPSRLIWRTPDASATAGGQAGKRAIGRPREGRGRGRGRGRGAGRASAPAHVRGEEEERRTADGPPSEVHDEARLELCDALAQEVEPLVEVGLGVVPPVHRARRKVGAVAVRRVGDVPERAEVVDPVQRGGGRGRVEAGEEEVDRVGLARAERGGELGADPCGGRGRTQRNVVAAGTRREVYERRAARGWRRR